MNTEFKRMQYLAGLITEGQLNEQESFDIEQARELIKQGKENFPLSKKLGITKFPIEIKDENGKKIYVEYTGGTWEKNEYDSNNNHIYHEDNKGNWYKNKYDLKGDRIYYENSDGYWFDTEYDNNHNQIYFKDSKGKEIDKRKVNKNNPIFVDYVDYDYNSLGNDTITFEEFKNILNSLSDSDEFSIYISNKRGEECIVVEDEESSTIYSKINLSNPSKCAKRIRNSQPVKTEEAINYIKNLKV